MRRSIDPRQQLHSLVLQSRPVSMILRGTAVGVEIGWSRDHKMELVYTPQSGRNADESRVGSPSIGGHRELFMTFESASR